MVYTSYFLPISAKGILFEGGGVWLRKNERREWELPGGKLDKGEQPTQTVERELKEELGFLLKAVDVVHAYVYVIPGSIDENKGVLVLSFLCILTDKIGHFEEDGEAGKAQYNCFSIEDVASLQMPDFYKEAIELAWKRRPSIH